jgi:hypothetical protein
MRIAQGVRETLPVRSHAPVPGRRGKDSVADEKRFSGGIHYQPRRAREEFEGPREKNLLTAL